MCVAGEMAFDTGPEGPELEGERTESEIKELE